MNLSIIKDITSWKIVLLFCFITYFFSYKPLVLMNSYENLLSLFLIIIYGYVMLKNVINRTDKHILSRRVSAICIMFALSTLLPTIFWGQSFYYTWRRMYILLPLCFYYLYLSRKVTRKQIVGAITILCIIQMLCQIWAMVTYPSNVIGYNTTLLETAENTLETRGVVRFALPGHDFIVCCIFLIITYFNDKKKYYLLLIPLFIFLLLRGTRTPFFVTTFIVLVYIIMNMKHKLLAISSGVIIYIIMIISYNYLLNGNSDDILSNYIKMTEQQIENNNTGEEDVRIRMTKYFFTEFNDNILQDILGNGVNGANSAYTAKVNACGDRGLCITDVLYPNIFMFFGYIGLLIYGMLFWTVFRLKVSKEGLFARLYILYGLLIGFTNTMLLLSSFIFSMCLYVLRIESRGKQSISKMFIFWK